MNSDEQIFGNLILYFLFGFVCGGYSAYIAESKGRGAWAWFFGGLLFNIIALIAATGITENLIFFCHKCGTKNIVPHSQKYGKQYMCKQCKEVNSV